MSAKATLGRLVSGDVFAGKFRLERQIASGGMGFVWRAWNMQLDIPVAIKVMAGAMIDSPAFVARFELEARAAAQIRSPHVVSIYEHGVHEGLPYMVMELLEGEDLSQRLKRETRLSMLATAKIVRDTCKALHRAHELGVVHRDIKPGNVFLARDGDDEIVKVLDFGIAKLTLGGGGNMTATGEMMGTPSYMSPEHMKASKHVDHRADLWSVSVIAFRSLTGQLPFTGQILDLVDRILHGNAPVPSTLAPDLSPQVDAFFARALARNINHRFQSARELSDALGKLVGRESLIEPSSLPGAAVEAVDLPTIVAGQPRPAQQAPWAAVAPMASPANTGTVVMGKHGSQQAFNAAPPTGEAQSRSSYRTVPLEIPPLLALALAASSPVARTASSGPVTSPLPRRRSWVAAVALASALIVIAAAFWALMRIRKSQEPRPAPLPAVSAH